MLHPLPFYYLYNQISYIQLCLYSTTPIVDPIYNRPCICCVLSVHTISMVGPSLFKPSKCSTPLEVDSAYNRPCICSILSPSLLVNIRPSTSKLYLTARNLPTTASDRCRLLLLDVLLYLCKARYVRFSIHTIRTRTTFQANWARTSCRFRDW